MKKEEDEAKKRMTLPLLVTLRTEERRTAKLMVG
jgi:hypothetical protein